MTTLIKRTRTTLMAAFIITLLASVFLAACDSGSDPSVHSAVTQDGVKLKLLRYRPDPNAPFNTGRQPVLMLPGVGVNMNEFLYRTTDKMKETYADVQLPEPLPAWAQGDANIQKDPLLLYNLGYFLYINGYDPWFANNRGTGRAPYDSEAGIKQSNLDAFGCLDIPALVQQVTKVTGKKPVIGGHSTGGVACYIYLQGAYMDNDEVMAGKKADPTYLPHVKVSAQLAQERNGSVKGYLALDPAVVPPLPSTLNKEGLWKILYKPILLPLDAIMETLLVDSKSTGTGMSEFMDKVFDKLNANMDYSPGMEMLHFWETSNMDPYVLDYFMRYAVTNMYLRIMAQYADWGLNNAMREGYTNGRENVGVVVPQPRTQGDGYYYYEDHMANITTPMLCLLSEYTGLVSSSIVLDYLIEAKTQHPLDQYFEVPGTAHADLPAGIQAPTIMFPMIQAWLFKVK